MGSVVKDDQGVLIDAVGRVVDLSLKVGQLVGGFRGPALQFGTDQADDGGDLDGSAEQLSDEILH
jgi:hypothetical protein